MDQLSLTVRYVLNNGFPSQKSEYFLTFIPSAGHKADQMFVSVTHVEKVNIYISMIAEGSPTTKPLQNIQWSAGQNLAEGPFSFIYTICSSLFKSIWEFCY